MSTSFSRRACLLAVGILPVGILLVSSLTRADTSVKAKVKCAICEHEYEATLTASSLQLGQRLDLRPVPSYAIVSPPRVAVCPKCGFVEYREDAKYPEEELKVVRGYVKSDEYKKLVETETTYFRYAKIWEKLKKPQSETAFAYLRATWEVENSKDRYSKYATACIEAYGKVVADEKADDEQLQMGRFLTGELLRRQGKFGEAKKQFDELLKLDESKKDPYPDLIKLELELIEKKKEGAQEIPKGSKKD
jgi:hypothetical protein